MSCPANQPAVKSVSGCCIPPAGKLRFYSVYFLDGPACSNALTGMTYLDITVLGLGMTDW